MVSRRSKDSPWFQKQNHIRLAKQDLTKKQILAAVPGVEYVQNRVETTGFEASGNTAGGKTGTVFEASVWLRPDDNAALYGVFAFGADLFLRRLANGSMLFRVEDTLGNRLIDVSTDQLLLNGTWNHVYCYFDNSAVGSGSYTLEVNGVLGTVNEISGPTYNGNDLEVNKAFYLVDENASTPWKGGIADLFVNVENGTRFGIDSFVDGNGDPLDPGNIATTPIFLLGSTMTASDWNSGNNAQRAPNHLQTRPT
jgi:hypothetical protein